MQDDYILLSPYMQCHNLVVILCISGLLVKSYPCLMRLFYAVFQ